MKYLTKLLSLLIFAMYSNFAFAHGEESHILDQIFTMHNLTIGSGVATYLLLISTILNRVLKRGIKSHKILAIFAAICGTVHASLVLYSNF